MNFLENISVVWQRLGLVQRAMLIAILIAGGITATFLTKWASQPDMRLLYAKLSAEDAGKISDKLAEKGIPFKFRGSSSIYVPKEHVHQLQASLAMDGLPGDDSPGYSLFDDGGFAKGPFQNKINSIRAIQDELAKIIKRFDTVNGASVLIVRPEQSVYKGPEDNSKASVFLEVKPGFKISPTTVAAITHLVSGSVEGLSAEGVRIVDSQGNSLKGVSDPGMANGSGTFLAHKEKTEQGLTERVQSLLEAALGPGRSKVMVSAVVDMDSEEKLITTYEKAGAANKKEEIDSTTETTGGGKDEEGNPLTPDEKITEKITNEILVPETTTKTVKMAGKITSLSASVFVDLTVVPEPVEVAEGETAPPPAAPTKIMKVEDVKEIIFTALGRDVLLEKNLTVVDMPFIRAKIPEPVKEPAYLGYIGMVKQGSLGIMAVCALLALKIFSGKVKPGKGGGEVAQIGGGEVAVAALPAGDMREQISLAYRSDPEQVKELFTSWIEEKS